jgi:hypothetical protein
LNIIKKLLVKELLKRKEFALRKLKKKKDFANITKLYLKQPSEKLDNLILLNEFGLIKRKKNSLKNTKSSKPNKKLQLRRE